MTLNDYMPIFLHYIETHRKAHTIKMYKVVTERYLKPEFGNSDLTDIKRPQVVALHLSLKNKPVMANRIIAVGRRMYNFAQTMEIVDQNFNPFTKINSLQGNNARSPFKRIRIQQVAGSFDSHEN